jgi:glycosyltransferase involved in cell wall biosynthesis
MNSLRIAMLGTRGVPAAYGGFETAVEEIGQRLASRGHEVTVYCRPSAGDEPRNSYLGMDLVHLPSVRSKAIETLSHTALSVGHLATVEKQDVAFLFNAANAPFLPALRMQRIPTAVHVDGLEWKRGKWGKNGRRYYRWAEQFSVRHADALISDAQGIADYYTHEFNIPTELITYGAPILNDAPTNRLHDLGLAAGKFHLVVARFEPENHVDVIVDGYRRSNADLPLVVVGSAPYAAAHTTEIERLAAGDPRIHLVGGIFDQELLDQLYAHAYTYIHGHSVGGTNPSLLRAMGAGTAVIAYDVVFNRDVLGTDGLFFGDAEALAQRIDKSEAEPRATAKAAALLQARADERYNWDAVTDGYEELAGRLHAGYTTRGLGRRNRNSVAWEPSTAAAPAVLAPAESAPVALNDLKRAS